MTRVREPAVRPVNMVPLELGEGARWLSDGPVQVDLLSGRLLGHRGGGVEVLLHLGMPLGAVALRAGGGLAVVAGTGVRLMSSLADQSPTVIDTGVDPSAYRVNDATTDHLGRLWFGVMPYDDGRRGAGSLWCLAPDLTLTRVLDGLDIPNGPVVDADRGVLYLADSARGVITRHRLDASGELGPGETFAEVEGGAPDGMALDSEGGLWSALWGGSRLCCFSADGSLTDVVMLPVTQPTSLALDPDGGPALVTSAWHGLENPDQHNGRSMWVDLGARGPLARPFGQAT